MPQYQSHKKVWALKIATVTDCGIDTTTDENPIVEVTFEDKVFAPRKFNLRGKPTPEAGWYFVQYADGYTSFSPANAFETGHTKVGATDDTRGIGWAIKQMHNGLKVQRAGWNGKGMFLFLVPGSTFTVNRPPLNTIYPEGTEINYCPHVDMRTADGKIVPWLASQTDLLAFDYSVVQ